MYLVLSINLQLISLYYQLLFHIRQQFFYNSLTTCHKELQAFLKLMANHCVLNVIHQDF